jgi:hypothetical protein
MYVDQDQPKSRFSETFFCFTGSPGIVMTGVRASEPG